MDAIKGLLFEGSLTLAGLCAGACLVLLVLWRRTGSSVRRKMFWGATAASFLLLGLQGLVVTDRERIINLVQELAAAAEKSDIARIEQSIDAAYKDSDGDREACLARARDRLSRHAIRSVSLSAFEVNVSGDDAKASFRVVCDMREGDHSLPNMPSRWELDLVRRGDTWMVCSIRRLQIGPIKASGAGGDGRW